MRLLECLGGSQEVRPCGMRWIQRAAAAQQAPRARDGQRLHRSPQRARQSGPHALASEVAAANAERSSALGCKPGGRGEGGCTRERREERDDGEGDRDGDGELGRRQLRNHLPPGCQTSVMYLIYLSQRWQRALLAEHETPFFVEIGMDFGDVVAARSSQQPTSGRRPSSIDAADIWKAAAADALAAEPPPPKTGWDSVIHKRGKNPSKRTEQVHRFGSFRTYFRLHGSAIFHRSVVSRSLVASAMAESAYYLNRCPAL